MTDDTTRRAPAVAPISSASQAQLRAHLKCLEERMQLGFDPGPEGQELRCRCLTSRAALCHLLGRRDEMMQYLSEAAEIDPDAPAVLRVKGLMDFYGDPDRTTPWDHQTAVEPYDDLEDVRAHAHLPFDEFFQKTKRGSVRMPICTGLRDYARPGERILEVGCAAGGYYATLKNFIDVSGYTAVDFTPAMVRHTKNAFPDLSVARMDIRGLAVQSESYPVVFSTDVLMHLQEWKEGLRELYRVCSRILFLRIRIHRNAGPPTLSGHVGAGAFRVPYIINDIHEFLDLLQALDPKPADIRLAEPYPEPMYADLWQLALEHPELQEGLEEMDYPHIDKQLDILVVKRSD